MAPLLFYFSLLFVSDCHLHPTGMGEFFELLQHENGDIPGIFSWISTHPDHAARIATVEAMITRLPERNYEPLDVDWPSIQERLRNRESK